MLSWCSNDDVMMMSCSPLPQAPWWQDVMMSSCYHDDIMMSCSPLPPAPLCTSSRRTQSTAGWLTTHSGYRLWTVQLYTVWLYNCSGIYCKMSECITLLHCTTVNCTQYYCTSVLFCRNVHCSLYDCTTVLYYTTVNSSLPADLLLTQVLDCTLYCCTNVHYCTTTHCITVQL